MDRTATDAHTCDPARRLDYEIFGLREEIAGFEDELHAYLRGPQGAFAMWLAARDVRRAA